MHGDYPKQQLQQPPVGYASYATYAGHIPAPPLRNPGVGIAAFVLALIAWGLTVATFACAVVAIMHDPAAMDDERDPKTIALGLMLFVAGLMMLLGVAFAIIGLLQRNVKRVLTTVALILNGVGLFGIGGLITLGLLEG